MAIAQTGSVRNQDYPEIQVDDSNKENELEQIGNPLVSRHKGRPETKRYKSSTEKKPRAKYTCVSRHKGRPETKRYKSSTEKKPRAKYTCGTCGRSGHNSARCQNRS
ncbi:hypothetical protein Glove_463g38 [Diversispora epigaea]|uniref:CCHC-type domain-containing protein n=1 Tax=Diversispora epigaea TaxID=1348612 RepID=A0A397GW07_9GLOM|nr:hypothetical protein Glove_463g38 [Diversispora epigaea]